MTQCSRSQRKKIGILGGGQLAAMMLPFCKKLDLESYVLDATQAPAQNLCDHFVTGNFRNANEVLAFGQLVDVLTIEIEDVSVDALKKLQAQGKEVYPDPVLIETIQDKGAQKKFFLDHGIPTAEFALTESAADITRLGKFLPGMHKLRQGGYDGRGVVKIHSPADIAHAFSQPAVLEKLITMEKEISVLVASGLTGETKIYPVVEMVFDPELHLLDYLISPPDIASDLQAKAKKLAATVAKDLGAIGILAVEMFLTPNGDLLVNEVAPRPHNSGHHTLEAVPTSQFEQHLRAVCGMPLGEVESEQFSLTWNLLGEKGHQGPARWVGLDEVKRMPDVFVHIYGKVETKPGRKMGHITVLGESRESVLKLAHRIRPLVKVIS